MRALAGLKLYRHCDVKMTDPDFITRPPPPPWSKVTTKYVPVDLPTPSRHWNYRPISKMEMVGALWLVGNISCLWLLRTKLDTDEKGRPCWNICLICLIIWYDLHGTWCPCRRAWVPLSVHLCLLMIVTKLVVRYPNQLPNVRNIYNKKHG